jgi:hypothetical protein
MRYASRWIIPVLVYSGHVLYCMKRIICSRRGYHQHCGVRITPVNYIPISCYNTEALARLALISEFVSPYHLSERFFDMLILHRNAAVA